MRRRMRDLCTQQENCTILSMTSAVYSDTSLLLEDTTLHIGLIRSAEMLLDRSEGVSGYISSDVCSGGDRLEIGCGFTMSGIPANHFREVNGGRSGGCAES